MTTTIAPFGAGDRTIKNDLGNVFEFGATPWTAGTQDGSHFVITSAGSRQIVFNGSSLGYTSGNFATSGLITSIEIYDWVGSAFVQIATWTLSDPVNAIDLANAVADSNHAAGDAAFRTALFGDNDTITGSTSDDTLLGYAGNDTINGGDGGDILGGGAGDDTVNGGNGNDIIGLSEDAEGDAYDGGANGGFPGADVLAITGVLAGDVTINATNGTFLNFESLGFQPLSGAGTTSITAIFNGSQFGAGLIATSSLFLVGSALSDTLRIQNIAGNFDLTSWIPLGWGSAGTDMVILTGNNGANVLTTKTTIAATLNGEGGNDTLNGGNSIDVLFGGVGQDTLNGGAGDDVLFGGANPDTLDGGVGTNDTVSYATSGQRVNVNLATGVGAFGDAAGDSIVNVESIVGSAFNDVLTGKAGANTLTGGNGDDLLSGGGGADTMVGGDGNDTYVVDNNGDSTLESSALGGTADLVQSSVTRTLNANIENLTLTGNGAIDGTGNSLANIINGNNGANTLVGLQGGDTLNGGFGHDILTGGAGADKFVFTAPIKAFHSDTITDFTHGVDKIQLDDAVFTALGGPGNLGPLKFVNGAAAIDGNDRIIYNANNGNLYYDDDGNGAHAQVLIATLSNNAGLTASDIQII